MCGVVFAGLMPSVASEERLVPQEALVCVPFPRPFLSPERLAASGAQRARDHDLTSWLLVRPHVKNMSPIP